MPVLRTVPVKLCVPPGVVCVSEQFCVTSMPGEVVSEHVADALSVTGPPFGQLPTPLAATVRVIEQESAGAVNVAVKFADAPGVKLAGTLEIVPPSLLTTATLLSVTSPVFLTVPL